MLKNAYLLAKIGADTAENERNFAENLPKFCNYPTGPPQPGPDHPLQEDEVPQAVSLQAGHDLPIGVNRAVAC